LNEINIDGSYTISHLFAIKTSYLNTYLGKVVLAKVQKRSKHMTDIQPRSQCRRESSQSLADGHQDDEEVLTIISMII
jgi:hypothetical protein